MLYFLCFLIFYIHMNEVIKFINECVQFPCAWVTHCLNSLFSLWRQLNTHMYSNRGYFYAVLWGSLFLKPMYTLLICRQLDTADLLLANGSPVTRYRVTQWCALLKKRHTCSPLRERKVHTHTHKHTQRLLGGTWQGATQWTKRTRWHKTSLRWAFYKLEHGRQMEQFTKTRPLGVSERKRSLSSPLSSLCSHWNSKVWCERMVKYRQKSCDSGSCIAGTALSLCQVHNRTDQNDRLIWSKQFTDSHITVFSHIWIMAPAVFTEDLMTNGLKRRW